MIGIVDIGSNTIRLSCYKIENDKSFNCIIHKKEVAGLAGYIDSYGAMSAEGIEKAVRVIEKFVLISKYIELDKVYFFATAAIRNTTNCQEIVKEIQQRTGYEIQVLSGEEEAICDFIGVKGTETVESGIVIDIGGGSTEIVSFENERIENAISYGIGSLNTYKKYVKEIVPTKDELADIKKDVKKALENEGRNVKSGCAYGVGGSIRAILRLYNKEFHLDEDNRDMNPELIRKLLKLYEDNERHIVERVIKLAPERLHTIIPGLTILCAVMKEYNVKCVRVSKYGVREGYLMKYVLM